MHKLEFDKGGGPNEKVLLSHDGKMKMYLVPDEVADNLKIQMDFGGLINDPTFKIRVTTTSGEIAYIAQDFIDYLMTLFSTQNYWLGKWIYDYEIPKEYKDIPWFNF